MKVSTRVEFGIIALADIAIYSENGGTVSSADIAARQNISQKYLEQIIPGLRQGGFVHGQKGSKGGYTLTRPADQICFCDILNALDNTILADTYVSDSDNSGGSCDELRRIMNNFMWNKLNGYMREFTAKMTLADFIEQYRKGSEESTPLMYYI